MAEVNIAKVNLAMSEILNLDFGQQLTIAQVTQMHTQMIDLMASEQDVQCNIENIQQCDTAGIQLLVHFSQSLQASDRKCLIAAESDTVNQVAGYLGLQQFVKTNI